MNQTNKPNHIERIRSLESVDTVDERVVQIGTEKYDIITVDDFMGVRTSYQKPEHCTPMVVTDTSAAKIEGYCPPGACVVETERIETICEIASVTDGLSAQQLNRLIDADLPSGLKNTTPIEHVSLGHKLWTRLADEVDCIHYQHGNIQFPVSGRKALARFFSVLIDNELLDQELPIRLNQNRFLVSRDPDHVDNMNRSKRVTQSYFVDTNMSNPRKKTEMRNIVQHLGVKFDGIESVNALMRGEISSYRELKSEAQRLDAVVESPPTAELVLRYGDVSAEHDIGETQWKKITGGDAKTTQELSTVDILEEIDRLAENAGRLPTKDTFTDATISVETVERRIGWSDALRLCQFGEDSKTQHTETDSEIETGIEAETTTGTNTAPSPSQNGFVFNK